MARPIAMNNPYNSGLERNPANFQPLTPLTFLERAASVYPEHTAIIHGKLKRSYSDFYSRSLRLASALSSQGIKRGDTVSAILSNTPAMLEAHYGVPMCGAVLHSINTRLDPDTIAYQLDHSDAKALIVDREFLDAVKISLELSEVSPILIDYNDSEYPVLDSLPEAIEYEAFLLQGDTNYEWLMPEDEWDAISLNYTSGTTGNPKGVVSHHRGAYLLAQGNAMIASIKKHSVYLWTLPMFHCNGWCFPWTLATVAGTTVCLRHVREDAIFDAIRKNRISHFCGAPVVLNSLINAADELKQGIEHEISVMTAGAAPPAAVIEGMESMGFRVTHVYGLTETYGPMVVSAWRSEWDHLSAAEKARLKARQGVSSMLAGETMVGDPETLEPVPWDGETQGEIFMRGNIVMKGYLKNQETTLAAFEGGWFHSGDLAVCHPDGYIQIKDRSKDIIISGGENISSIEIEDVLFQHSAILEAAVVAKSDAKWGETPCAFVALKEGQLLTESEVIDYCREHLARFKVPKTIIFGPLVKTSTGKVQKYLLREKAEAHRGR